MFVLDSSVASKVWVVGSAVLDTVYRVPRFPVVGESVLADSVGRFLGGKGSNQAVAAARAGGSVAIVGCLGTDPAGDDFLATYAAEGIDVTHVVRSASVPTGSAAIIIDGRADNQIAIHAGANLMLTGADFPSGLVAPDDVVVCQLEVTDEVIEAASRGGRFVFNPAPYRKAPDAALARAHVVTPNETEAHALTGVTPQDEGSCLECAARILDMGPEHVVLTLGQRGVFWTDGTDHGFVEAPSVTAVDPTGAGDVFTGVLATGIASGQSVLESCRTAVLAASLSVTRQGAIPSIPYKGELL